MIRKDGKIYVTEAELREMGRMRWKWPIICALIPPLLILGLRLLGWMP